VDGETFDRLSQCGYGPGLTTSPVECQEERASIVGQVRAESGSALGTAATIRLETSEGELVDQRAASPDGQFEFYDLRKGRYRMVAIADRFQTAQQEVDLRSQGNRVIVTVRLTPSPQAKQSTGGATSLTDLQAPGKARKEYTKGARALAAKDVDQARAHFERAVTAYPCYARAQTDLALTLVARRELAGRKPL